MSAVCCRTFLKRHRDARRGATVTCPNCARAWAKVRAGDIEGWVSWSDALKRSEVVDATPFAGKVARHLEDLP